MAQTQASSQHTHHPNPIPNQHHRRIELQSHADLTYLQQNLAKAAREKLDLHFPPQHSTRGAAPAEVITLGGAVSQSAEEREADQNRNKENGQEDEDPFRQNVRHLVDEFLRQTFQSASHSVSVNGIDATLLPISQLPSCSNPTPSLDEQSVSKALRPEEEVEGIHYTFETFDPRLKARLQSLHGELENLTKQVSQLRRNAPKDAAENYAQTLEAAMEQEEQIWEAEQEQLHNQSHKGLQLTSTREGWNEDVRDVYTRGVQSLAVLSGISQKTGSNDLANVASLTETVGRAQRARGVAMEFE